MELKAQTATHMMSREEEQRIHLKIGRDTNQEVTIKGMEDKNTTETSQTSTMEDDLTGTPMATTRVGVVQIPLAIPHSTPQPILTSHPRHRYGERETTRIMMFF